MLLHYTKTLICFGMIDFLIKIRKFSVSFLFFPFHPSYKLNGGQVDVVPYTTGIPLICLGCTLHRYK